MGTMSRSTHPRAFSGCYQPVTVLTQPLFTSSLSAEARLSSHGACNRTKNTVYSTACSKLSGMFEYYSNLVVLNYAYAAKYECYYWDYYAKNIVLLYSSGVFVVISCESKPCTIYINSVSYYFFTPSNHAVEYKLFIRSGKRYNLNIEHHLSMDNSSFIYVFFVDDSAKLFKVERLQTIKELMDYIITKFSLTQHKLDFAIFEVSPDGKRLLDDEELIIDIYMGWPKYDGRLVPEFRILFRRIFNVGVYFIEYDEIYTQFMLIEAKKALRSSLHVIYPDIMANLAAILLTLYYGEYTYIREPLVSPYTLGFILPIQCFDSDINSQTTCRSVLSAYKTLEFGSTENLETRFLQIYCYTPRAFAQNYLATVTRRGDLRMNSLVILYLSSESLRVYDVETLEKREEFGFADIVQWTVGDNWLILYISGDLYIEFSTVEAKLLEVLLSGISNRLVALLACDE